MLAQLHLRAVGGQVVVDELPEIGEAGGGGRRGPPLLDHRVGDLREVRLAQLNATWSQSREAEGRRLVRRQGRRRGVGVVDPVRLRPASTTKAGVDKTLALDEEAFG